MNSDLQKHKMSVYGGEKYDCDQCDYNTSLRSELQKHKKSVHENKNMTERNVII